MEYHRMINLLDNTKNHPLKLKTKIWVEVNDNTRGAYNTNSRTKFKIIMLKSSLFDYSDAYILVKGAITTGGQSAEAAAIAADSKNKKVKL